jgi:hypothetical protein
MAGGESLKSVARSHGVEPVQIRRWRAMRTKLEMTKGKARSVSRGRPSSIKHLEDQIIGWALEMRHAGVGLTYNHLVLKAIRVDPDFARKPRQQQYHLVRRLCRQNCLVQRVSTHTAQDHPQVTIDRATEWLQVIRPIVNGPTMNQQYILNMDQTPLPFSLGKRRTLSLQGERTVTVRQSGNEKMRCTVSLTVAADGSRLKPMMIFKGERNGRIAVRELPSSEFSSDLVLACQPNAYQDSENLLTWVDGVLVPHLQEKAAGTPVVLFLDEFSAHSTAEFLSKLESIGVQLKLIPGGCTWLVQPVDVGIGKPFKDRVRAKWWEWMIEMVQDDALVPSPSRELVQKWTHETWESMPEEIVRNSWRKTDLSWFV